MSHIVSMPEPGESPLRAGKEISHAARLLADHAAACGLLMSGSPFSWLSPEEQRHLGFFTTVCIAPVGHQNLVLEGPTSTAKSLGMRFIANALYGAENVAELHLGPQTDERVMEDVVNLELIPSQFARAEARIIHEANRATIMQNSLIKQITTDGAWAGITINPSGTRQYQTTSGEDAALWSNAILLSMDTVTTASDAVRLSRQGRLRASSLPPECIRVEGVRLADRLLAVREDLFRIPVTPLAEKVMVALSRGACRHPGGIALNWPEACAQSSCSCHSTSRCGEIGYVPAASLRLGSLARAVAAVGAQATAESPEADVAHLRMVLPLIATVQAGVVLPAKRKVAARLAIETVDHLAASVARFEERFADVIAGVAERARSGDPEPRLDSCEQRAIEAFTQSDHPAVASAVLAWHAVAASAKERRHGPDGQTGVRTERLPVSSGPAAAARATAG